MSNRTFISVLAVGLLSLTGCLKFGDDTELLAPDVTLQHLEIPGYVIGTPSVPQGMGAWMPFTDPLEVSQYELTNQALNHRIFVTILRYANSETAGKAFDLSSRSRPQAPGRFDAAPAWGAAHNWQKGLQTDVYLLKGKYVVAIYDLPSDLAAEQTGKLLEALSSHIGKAGLNRPPAS
jgi:hypothetical protein